MSWVLSGRLFGWLPPSIRRLSQPFLRVLLMPLQLARLKSLFRKTGGDALLVLNGGFPAGETCRLANIAWAGVSGPEAARRNIHNFHNFAIPARRGFRWYEHRIDRKMASAASHVISVSRSCAESLRIRPALRDYARLSAIYNGVVVQPLPEGAALPDLRRELGIGGAPMCLILANYEERKGHRFLFEAFAEVARRLPDAHLVCCGGGSGPEKEGIAAARQALAPRANIHMLGFVPNGNHLIGQADLVVISSQSFESFGLTAVEAMLRGVPVLATRVGGLPEVLGEPPRGGFLVEPDDVQGFADRITELLADPQLRKRTGADGKARAEAMFTAERMAREYRDALKNETGSSEAPAPGEWHYVLRRSADPRMAIQALGVAAGAVVRRLRNRLVSRRDSLYPPAIRALAATLPAPEQVEVEPAAPVLAQGPRRLKLATGWLRFDAWPNWATPFQDHEQYVSLHRWNWLLRALTDEDPPATFGWGIELVRSWAQAMSCLPEGDAGESYTTGERISNLCLFARHTRGSWHGLPDDLAALVRTMGLSLAGRIEYHSGELSGNHVINNARALLFAGHCASAPALAAFGRALIAERLPGLVKEGFLREGSSHYQYLFTRWLLELALLARECGDRDTEALVAPYLAGLVAACEFFRVDARDGEVRIPTFGDISPDAEPHWLAGLPGSGLARHLGLGGTVPFASQGWARLFGELAAEPVERAAARTQSAWRAHPQAGWYRLDANGWTAIWHAEAADGPALASHAHHDLCSLALYRHGREVLIDPGRHDYSASPLGRYGIGAAAHNSVTLDGRAPMLSRGDRLLPQRYRASSCTVSHQLQGQLPVVRIEHDGFARLGQGAGRHVRTFTFGEREVQVDDAFEGRGRFRMQAHFHQPLAAGGALPATGLHQGPPAACACPVVLDAQAGSELEVHHMVGCDAPIGGWRFPAYGERALALTQRFSGTAELPAAYRYRLLDRGE
ncbi:glycosyltransferase [Massilia solisilvae]|uniref:Glycosyltransferase n=1 Tax=Massilia solisilvae TaxID=1811225 RepID=A0ABT2BES4_9BURK|nr:glycosyltransferase [Massilia solisilvae]MCS0606992.1 glycosyltransferase [Massilia solisilvae]